MSDTDSTLTPGRLALLVFLLIFAVIGAFQVGEFLQRFVPEPPSIPISALPGPPRIVETTFELTAENSLLMVPETAPANERWADIAGNYYSQAFIESFRYDASEEENGPVVRVRIEPQGSTLTGRLEAKGLKPNFAYQIKLRGDYDRDLLGFGNIGGLGRWRLPGKETNYTDEDFKAYPNKQDVEAYLLFDFFITDSEGNAIREFALDHSLHVLWNATRQRGEDLPATQFVGLSVAADDAAIYARPKEEATYERIWAERERGRYETPGMLNLLPAHDYKADLVLTEESFHSTARDGGWWATVFAVPIEFSIRH